MVYIVQRFQMCNRMLFLLLKLEISSEELLVPTEFLF